MGLLGRFRSWRRFADKWTGERGWWTWYGAIGGTRGASDVRLCEAGCGEGRRDAERGRVWECWGGCALGGASRISGQANVAGGHGMARSAERVGRAMGGWSELLTSRGCDAEWRRA